jgi:hypothetical protein
MVEEQIIAALNRIGAALEMLNSMQQEQIAKDNLHKTKPSKKTFRYPPQQSTREYPQEEK